MCDWWTLLNCAQIQQEINHLHLCRGNCRVGKVCSSPPSNDSATEGDAMDVASGSQGYPMVKSSAFLPPESEGGSQRPARTGTARAGKRQRRSKK